jgi:hypothetical protein
MITVRREHLLTDAHAALRGYGLQLRSPLRVRFLGLDDMEEAGVGEGVAKEFLVDVLKAGFDPDFGLFSVTPDGTLYPNPAAPLRVEHASALYEFLGAILAKTLYEGILVELPLASFFVSKLLGRTNTVADLPYMDRALYDSLMFVKRFEGDDLESLTLSFAVEQFTDESLPPEKRRQVALRPNGEHIAVTAANRLEYAQTPFATPSIRHSLHATQAARPDGTPPSPVCDTATLTPPHPPSDPALTPQRDPTPLLQVRLPRLALPAQHADAQAVRRLLARIWPSRARAVGQHVLARRAAGARPPPHHPLPPHHATAASASSHLPSLRLGVRVRVPWCQLVLGGSDAALDVDDWMAHAVYSGGYHPQHPVILWLWQVLREFDARQRKATLKFATSCSRPPLLGFAHLLPQFCVHRATDEEGRLPTAATCMNLLKLPPYDSLETLRERLTYAIEAGCGFELS